MVSVDKALEVGRKQVGSLLNNSTRHSVPELELLTGWGGAQRLRGSNAKEAINEEEGSRMDVTASTKGKRYDFGGGDRCVGTNKFRDFLLMSLINFFAHASGSRVVNLGLHVVNEPRLVRAVKLVQDGVTTEATQGPAGDVMVSFDFTPMEVILF